MLAAKEKALSGGEVLPQAKTRVWGLPLENANGVGMPWPASSTLHWGWSALYVGTASEQLDQRYYNQNGSFWSLDRAGLATASPSTPNTWNLYAYAGNDPVNYMDPTGMAYVCSSDGYATSGSGTPSSSVNCYWQFPYIAGDGAGPPNIQSCGVVNSFDPEPGPPPPTCEQGPPPAPPPPPPPQLRCDYGGSNTPPAQFVNGIDPDGNAIQEFGDPISLMYHAVGGYGQYFFDVNQSRRIVGWIETASGVHQINVDWQPDRLVPGELQQNGANATFSDAPGIQMFNPKWGLVIAASITQFFTTTMTVTSNEMSVWCPVVSWQASVNIPAFTGGAVVTSPVR